MFNFFFLRISTNRRNQTRQQLNLVWHRRSEKKTPPQILTRQFQFVNLNIKNQKKATVFTSLFTHG